MYHGSQLVILPDVCELPAKRQRKRKVPVPVFVPAPAPPRSNRYCGHWYRHESRAAAKPSPPTRPSPPSPHRPRPPAPPPPSPPPLPQLPAVLTTPALHQPAAAAAVSLQERHGRDKSELRRDGYQ
jgi:hypothetical protein